MQRLRHRPSYFFYRGDRLAFHRLQDGATLARLDPYAAGEQVWLLHSGRDIAVTAEEVRDISKQVHGLDLPATRPDGGSCNCSARMDLIEARLAALEASPTPYIDLSERPVEESPIPPPPSPAVVALEKMEALKARVDGARASVPTELQTLMEDGESVKDAKQRLWPLLMSELEDLQNQEALFGKSIPRREEVESLLGVLGRLGEY